MQFSLESLAALATIVGVVISLLALLESRSWLVITSLFFVCLSIAAVCYAWRERLGRNATSTVIDGYSIDSLNIANLRRRLNRSFVIQEVVHTVRIKGEDMEIEWKYTGYCSAKNESAIEFSLNSDASTAFDQLNCVAFDLGNDPDMKHEIRPVLVGAEGISKRISVPFLEPLKANQNFGVLLRCTLPGCVKAGFGYYTSSLSFAQNRVPRSVVQLTFVGPAPQWVRVYETTPRRPVQLLKTLPTTRQKRDVYECVDVIEDRDAHSARIYTFWRNSV